jgi:hypothetical protein
LNPSENLQRVAQVQSSRGEKDEAETRACRKFNAKIIASVNRNG